MPGTVQGVNERAKREQWNYRRRAGRGGGREYPLSALPEETRIALAKAQCSDAARAGRLAGAQLQLVETITEKAAFNRGMEALKATMCQAPTAQRRLDAKLAILTAWETFARTSGLGTVASQFQFATNYNAGVIAVDDDVRSVIPSLTAVSIRRWRKTVGQGAIDHLAGRYGNRKGDTLIDRQTALYEFTVAMLVKFPHVSAAHIMQSMRTRFGGDSGVTLPSPRALQRWMTQWKRQNKQTYAALTNPDAWKNQYMSAFGSQSADVERVNQRWELDSTPGDVMLTDGRHAVIGVIDVGTRRARLFVSKTSKATAVATLLRHALLDWGVPEVAKTDNGSDYTSNHIKRAFRGLDIEQELCPPFQPWHKPHIERFFKTFSHGLVELLPGFIGHDVAERQAIEARSSFADRLMKRDGVLEVSMSSAEFQQFCDQWCDTVYLHNPHKGLNGKTPFEALNQSRDPVRKVTDERALDVLLAEAPANNGLRTVQKKGVELEKAWFIAPELEAHIGEQVYVRYDPVDLGRIYVFDRDDGFVCVAECPERTGMDRKEVASKAREMQKARVQEERRALKAAAKRPDVDHVVREILQDRAEAAGKLARIPSRAVPHESAGLAEAARATAPRRSNAAMSEDDQRAMRELERELASGARKPAAAKVVAIDDPSFNYRRWLLMDARVQRGEHLTDDELPWYRSYGDSDEYRAMERAARDFPELKAV